MLVRVRGGAGSERKGTATAAAAAAAAGAATGQLSRVLNHLSAEARFFLSNLRPWPYPSAFLRLYIIFIFMVRYILI